MIAKSDLHLFRLTDDSDAIVRWIEESFLEAEEADVKGDIATGSEDAGQAEQEKRHQRHRFPD